MSSSVVVTGAAKGIGEAIESALDMRSVKSTIVPTPDLIDD